jgi:hypothetical protein
MIGESMIDYRVADRVANGSGPTDTHACGPDRSADTPLAFLSF